LKERLSLTVQSGENQTTQVIAYDAADPSIHIWKGDARMPSNRDPRGIDASPLPVSIACEQGDWFLQINNTKRVEAKFVECDPLLLEFHDVDINGAGVQSQERPTIYVTE
jgi:hypothetical protein